MIECGFLNKVSTGVTAIGHLISDICLLSSGFRQQLFYDGGGLGWLYVEVVVNDLSFRVDYDGPGRTAGAIFAHDGWDFMGLWIPGGMGH